MDSPKPDLVDWLSDRVTNLRKLFSVSGPSARLLDGPPVLPPDLAVQLERDFERAEKETVRSLSRAVCARDPATYRHSIRVGLLARSLRVELGDGNNDPGVVHDCGLLHDLGKISASDTVLLKPAALTADERTQIEGHPGSGCRLLRHFVGRRWECMRDGVRHHHERWDGTGYPDGLAGEAIPEVARIVALCEVYDSLTHDQPWREAWRHEEAVQHIADLRGKAFDPEMTDVFLDMVARESEDA